LIEAFGTNTAAATQHYITNGQFEGRRIDLFDEEQYLRNYQDLSNAFGSNGDAATLHFITNGYFEQRTDRPIGFDGLQYIASYSDLIAAFGPNPAAGEQHYVTFGRDEDRSADLFNEKQYLVNYPDLAAAFGGNGQAATLHYIIAGFGENRTDGPIPRPVDDAVTMAEDSGITRIAVLGNDTDVDAGTNLVVTALGTGATTGAVAIAADGKSVTYDPTGQFDLAGGVTDTYTFSYTVSDGQGGTDTATVTVTVTGIGEPPPPPIATDDEETVGENGSVTFRPLANDTDFNQSPTGLTLLSTDTMGTLGSVETGLPPWEWRVR
jgi:hypothetical protein